jgi:acetyl esterase
LSWDSLEVTPEELRNQINARIFALETHVEPFAGIRGLSVPGEGHDISVRVYTPEGAGPHLLLVYIHGAAWIAGSLDTHDNLCRRLAARVPCLVVSVGYRLAPEHHFPAAVEDSYRALVWAVEKSTSLDAGPSRVAIAGDSAGGNIAAAVCLMARDHGGPSIGFQLLVNPALDFTAYDAEGFEEMREYREYYLRDPADAHHPYASPLQAQDLTNLPPAYIITGERDVLMREGEAYARRLREAGVVANVYRQAGMGHLAGHFARATEEAGEAIDLSVAALRGR